MSIEVKILGSGSSLPTINRNTTAQYIICNNHHILIDCGEGTQKQFRKFKVRFANVDKILISHLHGDHYYGLIGFLSTLHMLGRNKELEIYGPSALEQIIQIQFDAVGFRLNYPLKFIKLDGNVSKVIFQDDKMIVRTFPLKHSVPTNGFIIEEGEKSRKLNKILFELDQVPIAAANKLKSGSNYLSMDGIEYNFEKYIFPAEKSKSYAFCSDTQYDERIVEYIKDSTVLYHEATFANDMKERAKKTQHSTAEQAATIASKANVDKLLLGHISARYKTITQHLDEAKSLFSNTYIVNDGDNVIVSR